MTFIQKYDSPLGGILLAADETGLTGLWFEGEKYFADHLPAEPVEQETPVLAQARRWLDVYFTGKEPDFLPSLHPVGSAFRQSVWEILLQIPYGRTTTYGEIARQLAKKQGLSRMSAQAVGGAVGHNKISIIIPCHRVVGANGSLTGYAGGIDKKRKLLKLEHAEIGFQTLAVEEDSDESAHFKHEVLKWQDGKIRCRWANPKNERYIRYHDEEWGIPVHDDRKLFEMLILESFQAGLSWECVLNKREAFREAFDGFDLEKICAYDETKLESLRNTDGIIRNRLKIQAAVTNAQVFRKIQREYGSFSDYLWHFTDSRTIYKNARTSSPLSDEVSKDLRKRGMKFVGTTVVYAYLQAVGVISSHENGCFCAQQEHF
jgi:DNA-3-methyladenine glycosylase I